MPTFYHIDNSERALTSLNNNVGKFLWTTDSRGIQDGALNSNYCDSYDEAKSEAERSQWMRDNPVDQIYIFEVSEAIKILIGDH